MPTALGTTLTFKLPICHAYGTCIYVDIYATNMSSATADGTCSNICIYATNMPSTAEDGTRSIYYKTNMLTVAAN